MFFLFRLFGSNSPLWVRWTLAIVCAAGGAALIVFGLTGHNTIFVVRGVILLVLVAVVAFRVRHFRRPGTGRPNSNPY